MSSSDFGLKIGIEGEREFKQALTDINNQFKVLGSEMKLTASQFDKNEKSVESLTATNEVLNKEIEAQKQKVETLKAALKNASESFGENDSRTLKWATSLNNAQAELNNMERELQENNAALDEAEKSMDGAGDEAEDFGEQVEDAGEDVEDAGYKFETLGSICKAVGAAVGAAFTAVAAASVAAGKALVDMSREGAAYADTVLTESTVTGIATDKLQEYMYAAELVDVSTETLTKSMAKNIKSMKSAADGSSAMEEAYEALGVSVTDVHGDLRDSDEVYWEIIDALGTMDNETERDALAMQILGKSAQELNPLIEAGAGRMKELGEEAHSAGYVISDEMLSSYGVLDDQLQYLNVNAQAAKNALGTILLPVLTELAGDGVQLIGEFTNGILEANGDLSKMSDVIGEILPKILDTVMEFVPEILEIAAQIVLSLNSALTDNLPLIVETASRIVLTLLNGLIEALPQITEGAIQLITAFTAGLLDNLPAVMDAAVQMIAVLVQGIGGSLPDLIPAAVEAVTTVVAGLIDSLPMLLDAAHQLILGLADGLLAAIPELVSALPEIISAVVDFLIGSIPEIIDTGVKLLTSLVTALPEIISAVIAVIPTIIDSIVTAVLEGIPEIIQAGVDLLISLIQNLPLIIQTIVTAAPEIVIALVNAITENIPLIVEAGVMLLTALITNLPQIIAEIVKAVPQIVSSIVQAFTQNRSKIVESGANLVRGLWDGISSMITWLWNKVSGWVSGLVGNIKGALGIHSPSTVFAGIGKNMGLGLSEGFVDTMGAVEKDMMNAVPTDFDFDTETHGITGNFENNRSFEVTIPLTLNGTTLARILAEIQWSQNAVYVRNLGTV